MQQHTKLVTGNKYNDDDFDEQKDDDIASNASSHSVELSNVFLVEREIGKDISDIEDGTITEEEAEGEAKEEHDFETGDGVDATDLCEPHVTESVAGQILTLDEWA